MTNGWTGGQYSLFRAIFGIVLCAHLVRWTAAWFAGPSVPPQAASPLLDWLPNVLDLADAPALATVVLAVAAGLSVLFAIGLYDRVAAVGLLYLLACLHGRLPLLSNLDLLAISWILLAHILLPPAPYGAWAARGRTDPGNAWRFPPALFLASWVVLACCWGLLLFTHLGLIVGMNFGDWGLGLVMLHLFAFDPGWIKPKAAAATEKLFYDGSCGLCQRSVRFVLAEDRTGAAFRFAPLDSDAFRHAVPEKTRATLPDSIVVLTADGAILTRSTAVLHVLQRLGGVWRLLAGVARFVPAAVRDWCYDRVAQVRRRLFRTPADVCPVLPKHLRARFDV
jgi:predicted DCC family thiol-disulfide oxidoreductase YuxK